ncbi:MAG: UDP-N-acetylglucosamine 1-carboxyvinyltransferase [Eubacterium sp.]|nr:UDP-N-acetylglucosamine 1-carboxyvinyltransferase [Eubacterium sp.]
MEYYQVVGGSPLRGSVNIHGAKNSVLPILAASLLVQGESVIHNCPCLSDVEYTVKILQYLGASVSRDGATLTVNTATIGRADIPESLMKEMRSSIIFLGALAARQGRACVYLPGGCEIGLRPIDMHLSGLQALHYAVSFDGSNICLSGEAAAADKVVLPFPSVGATENLILSSVFLPGKTTIINAAREPEIEDLCNYLNRAGAKIRGALTPVIEIEGVQALHATEHTVIPDRIVAATFLCAAAITGGEVTVRRVCLSHLAPVISVFQQSGCQLQLDKTGVYLKAPKRLRRVKHIETMAYPGFPTDCQAPVCAMLATAHGTSVLSETVFENRFIYVPQLRRFGADITVKDRVAVISGVRRLHAADAVCTDLRGGAAVLLAAIAAEGESVIKNIHHIDRGYEALEAQLTAAGVTVKRIKDEEV